MLTGPTALPINVPRTIPIVWAPMSTFASSSKFDIKTIVGYHLLKEVEVWIQFINLPAVNPFLLIIFSTISLPAAAQRQGIAEKQFWVSTLLNPGRLSVQAVSQLASSGRPQTKSALRVSRFSMAVVVVTLDEMDSLTNFWRVAAKNAANWSISADDTLIHVCGCACQSFLIDIRDSIPSSICWFSGGPKMPLQKRYGLWY